MRLTGIPRTLWRHVAWELLRMFVVTTSVIVTVIAFGAAAKPLADNTIGADTILKYVALAMVPMLQFAMPFAAGFAATLVMHRFSTDNEVIAMSACGMGFRRIFAPVAILGSHRALGRGQRLPRPSRIHIRIGSLIDPPASRRRQDVEATTRLAQEQINRLLDEGPIRIRRDGRPADRASLASATEGTGSADPGR